METNSYDLLYYMCCCHGYNTSIICYLFVKNPLKATICQFVVPSP